MITDHASRRIRERSVRLADIQAAIQRAAPRLPLARPAAICSELPVIPIVKLLRRRAIVTTVLLPGQFINRSTEVVHA